MEVLNNFLRIKQGDKEDLLDYLSRFKSERDVLFRLFGKVILDSYCEDHAKYKTFVLADRRKKFKKGGLTKFIAVLFLRNSNYDHYRYLLVEYRKGFANKDNTYTADLQSMIDVMRQVPSKRVKPNPKRTTTAGDKTKKEKLTTSLARKKGEGGGD